MPYKTDEGQALCLVGSIWQLGNWEKFETQMTWQEGDVWTLENVNIPAADGVFQYKYLVL